jgi:hypothetical protein
VWEQVSGQVLAGVPAQPWELALGLAWVRARVSARVLELATGLGWARR